MPKDFFAGLLAPRSRNRNEQAREFVLNTLLVGSFLFAALAFVIVAVVSLIILHHTQVVAYFPTLIVSMLFFLGLYRLARKGKRRLAATLLIAGYCLPAIMLLLQWGILIPEGIVLLSLVIVLSGILIGSRYAFIASLGVTALLAVLLLLQYKDVLRPDTSWGKQYGTIADVLGFGVTFTIIGVVSWLYNRQMESSLARARSSERALARQKSLLEVTVEKRTQALQTAQAQKMKQFYHFAELGHVSTALLHDLSNHLALLTLDIESLGKTPRNRATIVKQSQKSIDYIEQLVQRVRYQLQGESIVKEFNLVAEISEAMQLLAYKAKQSKITMELKVAQQQPFYTYTGDFVGFRQLMSLLLTNAIESYDEHTTGMPSQQKRVVTIAATFTITQFIIKVSDQGRGIKPSDLNKIFNPFYTTRQHGMGIGLFIARQLVEDQFGGKLTVTSKPDSGTMFTIKLPQSARLAKKS